MLTMQLLENESIRNFIYSLNNDKDNIKIEIVGNIASLHHQDYDGKRFLLRLAINMETV